MEKEILIAPANPLSPSEVEALQEFEVPDELYVVINSLLIQNYTRREARAYLYRKQLFAELEEQGIKEQEVRDNCWLQGAHDSYRQAGWEVSFHRDYSKGVYDTYRNTTINIPPSIEPPVYSSDW